VLGDTGNFYEVPNPDLGPEGSNTFELGAKVDWAQALRLQPAAWVSLLSNQITREPTAYQGQDEIDGKQVRHRVNRDSSHFYGFDLGVETYQWHHGSLFGSVSWVDGGPENPRRLPPIGGKAGVRYDRSAWYVSTYVLAAGKQTTLSPADLSDPRVCEVEYGRLASDLGEECGGSAGWLTFNARAGYRFEALTLDLAALNLTDRLYRPHGSGVPAPGFDLAAQATLEY
jgi:outer membrane receptor protein involved in Fe transport